MYFIDILPYRFIYIALLNETRIAQSALQLSEHLQMQQNKYNSINTIKREKQNRQSIVKLVKDTIRLNIWS